MIERGRAVKAGATAGCFQAIVSLIPEHLFFFLREIRNSK